MRASRAMRVRSPVTELKSCLATVTLPLSRTSAASSGRSAWRAALTTVPTSTSVSVTVFSSCSKTARWVSRAARWNRLPNADPPTTSEIVDAMIGRTASRSAWWRSTT